MNWTCFNRRSIVEGTIAGHANGQWNTDHLPPDQVARFHEIYSKFAKARISDLLKGRLRQLLGRLPPRSSYVEEVKVEIPGSESDSKTIPSPSRRCKVRIGDTGFDQGDKSAPM